MTDTHTNPPASAQPPARPDLDDTGTTGQLRMATRFARLYEGKYLYVYGLDAWHEWTGTHWAEDTRLNTQRDFAKMAKHLWVHAITDKDLARDVRAVQSSAGMKGALQIAATFDVMKTSAEDMDSDPYLLNMPNGTLDLRTMELAEHNALDHITKITKGAWNPQADTTQWDEFLTTILPDDEVRSYLQRFTGLSLLGEVREHILAIATGVGGNGKGVFYNAVLHALGDYGHAAESDLFMTIKANANAASPAVLGLRGARFVVCSETEEDQKLAAALMKNLTGGDPITARPMYGSPITFEPSHTSLMVTNFLPQVKGSDSALWRRIRVIPFDVVIPEEQRDSKLPEKLKLQADAILTWAAIGWQSYDTDGLATPAAVTDRTNDYQHDSDAHVQFIEQYLTITSDHSDKVTRADIWSAWLEFVSAGGAETKGKPAELYDTLVKHGCTPNARLHNARALGCVQLTTSNEDTTDEILVDD